MLAAPALSRVPGSACPRARISPQHPPCTPRRGEQGRQAGAEDRCSAEVLSLALANTSEGSDEQQTKLSTPPARVFTWRKGHTGSSWQQTSKELFITEA